MAGHNSGRDIAISLRDIAFPVVLDVGANIGQSAAGFRHLLPGSIIHCFEPNRSAYLELEQNTAGLADLHLNQVAVGATTGVLRFFEYDDSQMSSFLSGGPAGRGTITDEVDVSVITLDDYCSELGIARVDLLKIDTQGYDLEVLKGTEGLLGSGRVGLVYTPR